MAQIKININGKEISADENLTILQVVRNNMLDDIPTLCYEERLGHISSCFLCVVEVEGARGLVPSCSTVIREGMVVRTRTEKVMEARRTCLELLFSDHYADCISPCAMECPAGVDIQGYLSLVRKGMYAEAVELIKEKNPLPIVCGRVCVRKCEVGCRRNIIDDPVGINYLKHFAAESDEGMKYRPVVKPRRGKSVAVVGGGPGGLSGAYYLATEGYDVTIYEGMPHAGGMLRYGIPQYRLPKELLDQEIKSITDLGVVIHCNQRLGRDFTLTELREKYDGVLLTLGSWGASRMRAENEDAPGVLSGLEVLRQVAEGRLKKLEGRVLVVGGGNTAIDVSRTSVRLGADETVILYRRTEAQMPAHQDEIDEARHEGVLFKFLTAPVGVVTDSSGRAMGLECDRMELGPPDKSGRPRPVKIEGSRYVEPARWIISAIGQSSDLECLKDEGCPPRLDKWGNIWVDENTMETSIPGVFSAGDVVTGAATVIEGIAGGRRAALAIHQKLSGEKVNLTKKEFTVRRDMFGPVTCEDLPCFQECSRLIMPQRDPGERIGDFVPVELGIAREDVTRETTRCFECGCLEVDSCLLRLYGEEYGVLPERYLGEVNRYKVDREHPFIQIDPNKCIQCGRCIRTCEGILGGSALGFVNRGFRTYVAPSMEMPLARTDCISCGNCIDSCPTGALSENQTLLARTDEGVKDHPGICTFCSVGCRINIKTFGRDLRIRSNRDQFTGFGDYLCRRGRFGSSYIASADRLRYPFRTDGDRVSPVTWDEAFKTMAERLSSVVKNHGRDSVAVLLSPRLTNEEIFAGVTLARKVLLTDMAGSFGEIFRQGDHHRLDSMLGHTVSTLSINDLDEVDEGDLILVVNADPVKTHPPLGWKIRKAAREGKPVAVISSTRTGLGMWAKQWIQPRRGTITHLINSLCRGIIQGHHYNREFVSQRVRGMDSIWPKLESFTPEMAGKACGIAPEEITRLAGMIASSSRIIVVYDSHRSLDRAGGDLEALGNLLLLTGNLGDAGKGLILLQQGANTTGLMDMGAEPGHTPEGYVPPETSLREMMESRKIKAVLAIGEDPLNDPDNAGLLQSLEFLGVIDLFESKTAQRADLVLPGSAPAESGGSFTRMDRKIQRFAPATKPPGGKTTLEIIIQLAKEMGSSLGFDGYQEAWNALAKANPLYGAVKLDSEDDSSHYWTDGSPAGCPYLYRDKFATIDGMGHLVAVEVSDVSEKIWPPEEYPLDVVETRYRWQIQELLFKTESFPTALCCL